MGEPSVVLAPGRERSVERRHPWIFRGALAEVRGEPAPGDTVEVQAADGRFLAWASLSPTSQIAARVWTWDQHERVDEAFIRGRVRRAVEARSALTTRTDGLRLAFAENDALPGVIADRYGAFVVLQLSSAGAERWRRELVAAYSDLPGVAGVYERSDLDIREREGLAPRVGVAAGEPPPPLVSFTERAARATWRFEADLTAGQKTGFYLDQRENRGVVAATAPGRRTLNLFCYSGAFSVAAASGGAEEVTSVDSSRRALDLARANLAGNDLAMGSLVEADVFSHLRLLRDRGERFDLVVLDPPKMAQNASQVQRATRAYKDLNLLAIKLLDAGGVLVTFSCSGAIGEDLFQKVVFGAALDAGRDVQIVDRLTQAGDHPVLLSFPEGAYLKGLVCRVS